jgi:hypothetical protein
MKIEKQDQLSGCQIRLHKKANGQWKAILPCAGTPFAANDDLVTIGKGQTVIAAISDLILKLQNVPVE